MRKVIGYRFPELIQQEVKKGKSMRTISREMNVAYNEVYRMSMNKIINISVDRMNLYASYFRCDPMDLFRFEDTEKEEEK